MTKNGVILIATTQLQSYGYCDFTLDGGWDPSTMEQHPNVPGNAVCVNDPFNPEGIPTTWDGQQWVVN